MSNQQSQQNAGPTQWTSLQKKKKGPLKVSAIKKMEIGLSDDSNRLTDPVVIAITCGDYSQQLVLHRPVGSNDLQPSDWVLTPISEVEPLLAFAVDPAKEKKDTAKRNLRMEVAKTLGLYVEKDKVLCFPDSADKRIAGKSITSFNAEAKLAYDAAKQSAHDEYIAGCEANGRTPKKDWKFGQTVNHFLPKEVKDYEENVRKKTAESAQYKDGIKKIEPVPYKTMAGPFQDRPQSCLSVSGKIQATKEQMVDLVKRHVVNTMSGGYKFPLEPPANILANMKDVGKESKEAASKMVASFFVDANAKG
jgi:hypothetical protein